MKLGCVWHPTASKREEAQDLIFALSLATHGCYIHFV